jgi:cytochrome c oxidase subunit IV
MSTSTTDIRRSGRHPVNVTHLVMGLVFLGIAASWVLRQLEVIDADGWRWALPAILVLAGAAGLVAAVAKGLGRDRSAPAEPHDEDDLLGDEDPVERV